MKLAAHKFKSLKILPLFLIIFSKIPLRNAQQTATNTSQPQSDGKGLKAMVESKNETTQVKIDPIRKEMRDFMRECGVDVPEEEDVKGTVEIANGKSDKATNTNKLGNLNMAPMASDNLNDGRKKKKKKGTYPTSYGNSGSKRKNKKRRGNNDCDDDYDNVSCEDDDDDKDDDSDEDDDRRGGKGKKKGKGHRGGRNRRDMSTLVEQFNVTDGAEIMDEDNTEMNESFKNKKDKRKGGGNKRRGGNRDDDSDEDEDEDDDGPNGCGGGGRNKGGGKRKGGKDGKRGGQGGGGKKGKNKGGRGTGGKKHGGGGDDGFGGGGNPFETGAGGLGPGMGDHYGYPGLSGSGYFQGNPYGYGSYAGYIRQLGDSEMINSRIKRQEEKIECVSQCVFGYMEILDDNRVPSETALISYYQDKLTNNDKKSETIRNIRTCFARLVATDTEDGCKFSKAVSKCLKLDLDP